MDTFANSPVWRKYISALRQNWPRPLNFLLKSFYHKIKHRNRRQHKGNVCLNVCANILVSTTRSRNRTSLPTLSMCPFSTQPFPYHYHQVNNHYPNVYSNLIHFPFSLMVLPLQCSLPDSIVSSSLHPPPPTHLKGFFDIFFKFYF